MLWIVSEGWVVWKQVWRSFSSEELRAWVRTVDREEAEGSSAVVAVGIRASDWGCSWESRSAKERSVERDLVPFICAVGGSVPVKTRARDSSYG